MRPVRLELEGFTSFRERTEVTFENTELFVLTGPTGSGKSSLIDAMIFALYGCVPRYDDRRLVAPVISQGKVEAKVRFDFQVDGEQYTAVRVVRRTSSGGATTKEARLETDGRVLAGNEKDLTAHIENDVVRLSFDHFTKCVVLPQGEFAQFLRTKPSDRQDVLVRLLDLDLFGRIGQRANQFAKQHKNKADLLQARLDEELADATEDAVKRAKERVQSLENLNRRIEDAGPTLEELQSTISKTREKQEEAKAHLEALQLVDTPEGVAELSERYQAAKKALTKAEEQYGKARDSKEKAEEKKGALPERSTLEAFEQGYAQKGKLDEQLSEKEGDLADMTAALQELGKAESAAQTNLDNARQLLEALKRAHTATDLAQHLEKDEPCPVCLQVVDALPEHDVPEDLTSAKSAVEKAQAESETRRKNREAKQRELASLQSTVNGLQTQLKELEEKLAEAPPPDTLKASFKEVEAAEKALQEAAAAEKTAHEKLKMAQSKVKSAETERSKAWQAFDRARDGVARLQPPEPDRDDLRGSWIQLTEWAGKKADAQKQVVEEAKRTVERSSTERDELISELRDACAEAGLDADDGDPSKVCLEALGRAHERYEDLERKAETRREVVEQRRKAARSAEVARSLGRHLSATGFERWLLNRALRSLVAGATAILKDLSDGAYSLSLADDNTFEVIDHRNADEHRSAKTLSGGETFLASLSLALALADHVGELAARGSARLDALFLDEGFGTLDSETLDTVTAAIQELGARGRMVGLVTHVRELAEAIPVQYQVKKVGNVSSVERIVA